MKSERATLRQDLFGPPCPWHTDKAREFFKAATAENPTSEQLALLEKVDEEACARFEELTRLPPRRVDGHLTWAETMATYEAMGKLQIGSPEWVEIYERLKHPQPEYNIRRPKAS